MKLAGIVLIVLGILAVVYGGFWYTKDETKAEIGPITVKVEEHKRVNVPLWLGVAAIVGGAVVVTMGRRRSGA